MPWLIDGGWDETTEFLVGGPALDMFERVVVNNVEALSLPINEQYGTLTRAGRWEYDAYECALRRQIDEVGNVYYVVIKDLSYIQESIRGPTSFTDLTCRCWRNFRGCAWVCERFKVAVEKFEPGVHQFVPVDIRMKDHVTPWPERYWFWRCQQFIDAVVPDIGDGNPDRSYNIKMDDKQPILVNDLGGFITSTQTNSVLRRVVLSRSAIQDHHVWKENGFRHDDDNNLFLSDELYAELERVGASWGLAAGYVETSDLPAERLRSYGDTIHNCPLPRPMLP